MRLLACAPLFRTAFATIAFRTIGFRTIGFLTIGLLPAALSAVLAYAVFATGETPLVFASEESRTIENKVVFNKITVQTGWKKDIWTMRQSHTGADLPSKKWDQIAIVVNHDSSEASFYQLEPESEGIAHPIPLKVDCARCHPNGPRAIRPSSYQSVWDRVRVIALNTRIKLYGKLDSVFKGRMKSFGQDNPMMMDELKVPTCNMCHKNEGLLARGTLLRRNYMSIRFMIDKGYMPPLGFTLTNQERQRINEFVGRQPSFTASTF